MIKLIDYFAAPQFSSDMDLLYKARLLAGLVLSCLAIVTLISIFFVLFPTATSAERDATMGPVLLVGVSLSALLLVMRCFGHFLVCANTLVGVLVLAVVIGIYISGGPVRTTASEMIIMPVVLAYCLLGFRGGLFWASVVLLINGAGLWAAINGYAYPMVTTEASYPEVKAFNWTMGFLGIVAIVIIYELINQRLRQERNAERQRYQEFTRVVSGSSVVDKMAKQLSVAGGDLLRSAMHQKRDVEQLLVASEELGATAEQNSHRAIEAMQAIRNTEDQLQSGSHDVVSLMACMQQISRSSEEIQQINNLVNEIAQQTNLLSLNAMIEASRSGDENGGFQVVALEVKNLAERSADAVNNINQRLENNLAAVRQGEEVSSMLQHRFDDINSSVAPLFAAVQNVADASSEQNEAIVQIQQSLDGISASVDRNRDLAETTSGMSAELECNASNLQVALEKLKRAT